jgi:hypothetical protein
MPGIGVGLNKSKEKGERQSLPFAFSFLSPFVSITRDPQPEPKNPASETFLQVAGASVFCTRFSALSLALLYRYGGE